MRARARLCTIGGMAQVSQEQAEEQGGKRFLAAALVATAAWLACTGAPALAAKARTSVHEATLEEQNRKTPRSRQTNSKPSWPRECGRVRRAHDREYAVAHIPGSRILDEKQLGRFTQYFPDRNISIVVYSNGPFCERARIRSEELLRLGYTKITLSARPACLARAGQLRGNQPAGFSPGRPRQQYGCRRRARPCRIRGRHGARGAGHPRG